MEDARWDDPRRTLATVQVLMGAPLKEILPTLSRILVDLVKHDALLMLTGDCPKSPTWTFGDNELIDNITATDLAKLSTYVDVGRAWWGRVQIAGATRPVLAAASAPAGSAGAMLAVLPIDDTEPDEVALGVIQQLWDLAAGRIVSLLPEAMPVNMAGSWMVNSDRSRLVANLTDAHLATLTALLGILRTRTLDDRAARRTALDLAVSAVVELRGNSDDGPQLREEPVTEAFDRLTDMLGLLSRYGDLELEFEPPSRHLQRMIPADIAHAARTTARGTVLTMLEQGGVGRIRVSWEVDDAGLLTTVRDDGPGTLATEALAVHRLTDRVVALNGSLKVDAVPGWGTIVSARLPLAAPDMGRIDPLSELNPRELEVLNELVQGQRNRGIAERLHISEHTVKFHVAQILKKLGVNSRGEAAALARASVRPPGLLTMINPQ